MIVASADLSNSDKTDGFLKKTKVLRRAISLVSSSRRESRSSLWRVMNGMAFHGGVIPVCEHSLSSTI